mgnify:CR=1 FL=1
MYHISVPPCLSEFEQCHQRSVALVIERCRSSVSYVHSDCVDVNVTVTVNVVELELPITMITFVCNLLRFCLRQVEALQDHGVEAAGLTSDKEQAEQSEILRDLFTNCPRVKG